MRKQIVIGLLALFALCGSALAQQSPIQLRPVNDVVCGAAVSSCVLKAAPAKLFGVYANCTSACWLMIFNATSAPSNGATTTGKASGNMVDCIPIAAGGANSITYPTNPIALSVGITATISSTACATLTLSAVGFIHGTVQ